MPGLLPLTPLTVTPKSPTKPARVSLFHLYPHQLLVSVKRAKLRLSSPELSFKRPDRRGDLHSEHMGSPRCKPCDPSAKATSVHTCWNSKLKTLHKAGRVGSPSSRLVPVSLLQAATYTQILWSPLPNIPSGLLQSLLKEAPLPSQILHKVLQFPQLL